MTFRRSRQPRGGAGKRTRKREEIKEAALVRRHRGLVEAKSWAAPQQEDVHQAATSIKSAAAATAEAEALFMSKFGNLSVGGGGAETDTGEEAGSGSGESADVFKRMDAECTVYMEESKVRQHQVAYSVDDLYLD